MDIYKLPINHYYLDDLNEGRYEVVYISKEEYERLEGETKELSTINFKKVFAYILKTKDEYQKIIYTPLHKYKVLELPSRIYSLDKRIEVEFEGTFNFLKFRKECSKHAYYKIRVNLTDSNGSEIDTLGKWLFGTPTIKGHIHIEQSQNKLFVSFPKDVEYIERMIVESL